MTPDEFHARMWEILGHVDVDQFEVVAASAPTAEQVGAVEAEIGFALPTGVLAFAQRTNGLCVLAKEELWPAPREYQVAPAWTLWRGLTVLGFDTPDLPDWASITQARARLVEQGINDVAPLIKLFGTPSYWGVTSDGSVVAVDGWQDPVLLTQSLTDVYAEQIEALMARMADYLKG